MLKSKKTQTKINDISSKLSRNGDMQYYTKVTSREFKEDKLSI